MSTWVYGAARLIDTDPARRLRVQVYWKDLARLHGVWLEWDTPTSDYLNFDIAELWSTPDWLRFSVSTAPGEGAADRFLFEATEIGCDLVNQKHPALTIRNAWTRVPHWQFLWLALCHRDLVDAYLLVEDASGDAAIAREAQWVSLIEALDRLWWDYCVRQERDEPILLHIELSLLPG
jgi:hypothetical protein